MNCDNCGKESQWLEIIGAEFICKKCIEHHPILGNLHRTHINTFRWLVKKMDLKNYQQFMSITRQQIEQLVDLKSIGIKLKTTNVVVLD